MIFTEQTAMYLPCRRTYLYANPSVDFYSVAWDIIIPFADWLFAAIIFLQQTYGGFLHAFLLLFLFWTGCHYSIFPSACFFFEIIKKKIERKLYSDGHTKLNFSQRKEHLVLFPFTASIFVFVCGQLYYT